MHYHRSTKRAGHHKLILADICLTFALFPGLVLLQECSVDQPPYGWVSKALDQTPGISVGFIKGNFTWTRGFGSADPDNRAAAKPESAYRQAEITADIYTRSSGILQGTGDMFYNLGQGDIALYDHKKAWELDRKLKDVQDKRLTLEKGRKK